MIDRVAHHRPLWRVQILLLISTIAILAGTTGCPNSPLANLLNGNGNNVSEDETVAADILPKPVVTYSGVQGDRARIEWQVAADDPKLANVVAFDVYRSESPDEGFVIRHAVAVFEEQEFVDLTTRGGKTYYYYVVAADRLGREGTPSDTATVELPVQQNQVIFRADQITGTINPSALGVADLNAGADEFTAPVTQASVTQLGTHWWRVGLGRWDAGDFLGAPQIVEREIFVGSTLADAQDPTFYRWTYLDRVLEHVQATGATPIVSIDTMPRSLARNTQMQFRAAVLSWSDGIRNSPPADNAVFAEVVKRIIMHYTRGWGNGKNLNLPYWELWNAPDLDETFAGAARTNWDGTSGEFAAMYAAVHAAVKAEFGQEVEFGGAGFVNPDSIGPFLDTLNQSGVTPDFISFSASADLPTDIQNIASRVVEAIQSRHLSGVQVIASGWNLALPVAGLSDNTAFFVPQSKFDTMLHAIHYLAMFEMLDELGVVVSLHDGLLDLASGVNPGLLSRSSNSAKPVGIMAQAVQEFAANPSRLKVEPSTSVALAGMNAEKTDILLLLVNPSEQSWTIALDIDAMPWDASTTFDWSLEVLSDQTFADLGDFISSTGGSVTGRYMELKPTIPALSVIRLRLFNPRPTAAQ